MHTLRNTIENNRLPAGNSGQSQCYKVNISYLHFQNISERYFDEHWICSPRRKCLNALLFLKRINLFVCNSLWPVHRPYGLKDNVVIRTLSREEGIDITISADFDFNAKTLFWGYGIDTRS